VGPVCFDGPARYEITHGRRKLVGSAQSRRLAGVLQHGTLPLEGDISRIVDGLVFEDPAQRAQARAHLGRRALTLESALGRKVTFAQAVESMAAGLAQALNLELVPAQLTPVEWAAAERLRAEKYTSDGWTFKK
jgi:lipoate-protein ligase A